MQIRCECLSTSKSCFVWDQCTQEKVMKVSQKARLNTKRLNEMKDELKKSRILTHQQHTDHQEVISHK